MAETFNLADFRVPGTFVQIRAEGLIGVGGIATGNIGIVGTAAPVVVPENPPEGVTMETLTAERFGRNHIIASYAQAQEVFGTYDALGGDDPATGSHNLVRGIEQLFRNGARAVFVRAVPAGSDRAAFEAAIAQLAMDEINLLVVPELSTGEAIAAIQPALTAGVQAGRDMIAVIGADATTVANINAAAPTNDRIVYVAPGFRAFDSAASADVNLAGRWSAAPVAALLSSLAVQSSPTNKRLPGVTELTRRFSYPDLEQLIGGRVLALEQRGGVRVVRGLTSDNAAFTQITTRRIVDFAKAGARAAGDPFIGRLNNARVRAALQGAIAGFFDTMVSDEALVEYQLEVTASRDDEIAGRAIVNALLRPTFSIDFIAVTLTLE